MTRKERLPGTESYRPRTAQNPVRHWWRAKTNLPRLLLRSLHDKEKKRRKAWGEDFSVLFLHAAFLLRLFLLSVRRLVHPAQYSQRSLLKNSPLFSETNSFQSFFWSGPFQFRPWVLWQNFLPLDITVLYIIFLALGLTWGWYF